MGRNDVIVISSCVSLSTLSGRHILALILIIADIAALIAITLWNPLVGIVFATAVIFTFAVTRFLSPKRNESADSLLSIDRSNIEPRINVQLDPDVPAHSSRPPTTSVSTSALFEATMNSMLEGVVIVDHEMRIIALNSAAKSTFQAPEAKPETQRLSDITRNPAIHDAFRAALEESEHAEVKVELRRGDRRIFDLRVAPLRFEGASRSRGAIGVFFDITQLERLERVRQEFLSNVSHELRTPLTAIIAFVETLEEGAIDDVENNRRFLNVIRKNAERMHSLIDDILELSSIEAGIVTVHKQPIRLRGVIDDVVTALAANASARQVAVRNEVPNEVVVLADPRRLEQMLTNLVDNAIKFNRESGEIFIRHADPDSRDCISVEDTGSGISNEHIERIFERFYRIDRARSREMGGTGLGLAIVKHLARSHGGEATVQSSPGKGSTFTIELPKPTSIDA